MQGRRVYPNEKGDLVLAEGDYGKDSRGVWTVRPPGHHAGGIPKHEVAEFDDGTITVSPSILLMGGGKERYHGYLERGMWRKC